MEKETNTAGSIIKKVITTIVFIIAVIMMIFTILSVTAMNKNKGGIAGYKAFIVLSDSMKATDFEAGDLVIVKETDPNTLTEGDIIAFISQNDENYGETVTHKIRKKTVDEYGEPGFVTFGTTTNTDDAAVVTFPYIIGKCIGSIPKLGKFFSFLKTVPGYICCILVPFLLLIGIEGLNCIRLFKEYKKGEEAELKEEREKLDKEREETKKMMEELTKLKAQLENKVSEETDTNTDKDTDKGKDRNTEIETDTDTETDKVTETDIDTDTVTDKNATIDADTAVPENDKEEA